MPSIRRPSKVTVPATGRIIPETVFCVVVLPAPLAPSSATISPSRTSKLTPFSAAIAPYRTSMSATSSSGRPAPSGTSFIDVAVRRPGLRPGVDEVQFRLDLHVLRGVLRRRAEVGADDGGVLLDLLRGALGDLPAEVEHDDAVRHRHHQFHVVLDEQHGDVALLVDAADEFSQLALLHRIRTRGRLVQQDHPGVGAEPAGYRGPPLPAVRERAPQIVRPPLQPDVAQQGVALSGAVLLLAALPGHAEHGGDRPGPLPRLDADLDVLQRRERREEPDVLERAGD